HDYHTYSSNIYFNMILSLEPYQPHPYQWCIGECGFGISSHSPDQYETDQAKYFQYFFQAAQDLDARLCQTPHHLLGVGIWSVEDYDMGFDDHEGVMSSEKPNDVRKRKAAFVIENNLAGYVANADFEIGPGNDVGFGDTPWCNGWTAYYPACCQEYHKEDYSYTISPGHGHVLQLNPAPTRQVGWSNLPGGMIRVKPNTRVTVSVEIKVSKNLNATEQLPPYFSDTVFAGLTWRDMDGRLIRLTPLPAAQEFPPNSWTTVSVRYTAPSNAYYAVPYLMAYSSDYTVQFDSLKYLPEWRPLISFTFDDEITYFNPKPQNTVGGWWTSNGASSNKNGVLSLTQYGIVKTTHYLANGAVTGLRMREGNEYSVVACISSMLAHFKCMSLQDASSEYPSLNTGVIATDTVSSPNWNIYSTTPIQYGRGYSWLQVQFEDGGFADTKVREVEVFEHTISSSQTQTPSGVK
ncbi:MAG: hypothetical protein WBZ48_03635, partial [Bacteroidota bacterium]